MIFDILYNIKLNPTVTDLFIRDRELNLSIAFIAKTYCAIPKSIRLKCSYNFIMKIPNKREFQTAFNDSSDTDFKDFMNLYKKCTEKPKSFLVANATLPSDNPLCFGKNVIEKI